MAAEAITFKFWFKSALNEVPQIKLNGPKYHTKVDHYFAIKIIGGIMVLPSTGLMASCTMASNFLFL